MGTASCLNCIDDLKPADWIAIAGILINSGLAIWIVLTIQNKLTNRRVLKDHFIGEVKELRNEFKTCLNNLYANKTHAQRIIPWFKLMNIKVADLMGILSTKYNIDKNKLSPFQTDLRELITNNPDFINQFNTNNPIKFSEVSRSQLIKFQQDFNALFNELIIAINDGK